MKKLIAFLIVALCSGQPEAMAQYTFGKAYSCDGAARLIPLSGGKTLANIGWGSALTLLDSLGQPIWTQWKRGNEAQPIYYPWRIAKLSESSFYGVGGYQSSGFQPVLARLDSTGDVVEAARYAIANTMVNFVEDLTVTMDSGTVMWSEPGFNGFFMLRTRSDLSHQWSHFFNKNGAIKFVKELPGGDLLAGINMDTAGAAVARYDAEGNLLWCKSYIRPKGVVHDAVVESDSSFVITGYTDSTAAQNVPPGYAPKLFLMKLNGAGEVQWCKGYKGANRWYARDGQKTVPAQGGGYVLMANAGPVPVLLKLDANGDTLWTRATNTPTYTYSTMDMTGREDGGYMLSMAAFGYGFESGGPSLIKTDSLGHFPCGDRIYPVQITDLFPVDSAFALVPSVSGATAYPVTFRDTVFDPITTYDLCSLVTDVPNPVRLTQPRIRPNPSTGQFTVSFTDPLTADSFYSVYDATGQLLFQRPLTTGSAEVQMDLSRYGKGMYLVRFSDRNGVCSERVVVE